MYAYVTLPSTSVTPLNCYLFNPLTLYSLYFPYGNSSYFGFIPASSFPDLYTAPSPIMYVYVGKLNWLEYAQNECITIVFPAGFALDDPVCAYWQWTVNSAGKEKANATQNGLITSVTKTASEYSVRIPFDYYAFEGTVSADFSSLSLKMFNPQGDTTSVSLSLQRDDGVRIPSTSIFTGKLDWLEYSKNEMVTLVIPGEVATGGSVILNHQWTEDAAGNVKANHTVSADLNVVRDDVSFSDGYYTYSFPAPKIGDDLVLSMTNPSGVHDSNAPYTLKQTDFRDLRKKKVRIASRTSRFC